MAKYRILKKQWSWGTYYDIQEWVEIGVGAWPFYKPVYGWQEVLIFGPPLRTKEEAECRVKALMTEPEKPVVTEVGVYG